MLFIGQAIIMGMIIYVGDPVNILWSLPLYLVCVMIGAEGTLLARGSMAIIFFTLATSLAAIIDNSFYLGASTNTLIRVLVWIPIYWLVRYFVPRTEKIQLSPRLWLLLDGLAIAPFASLLVGVTLTPEPHSHSLFTPAVVMLPFALLSSISLLAALMVLARQEQLEQENTLAQINQTYYAQLEQHQKNVRRLRHDMANHLQTIVTLPEEEIKPYLRELLEDSTFQTGKRVCENTVVNAVLSAKLTQMEEEGIHADCKVSLPENLPFADTDLCSLFANSLDNAIEACRKVPQKSGTIRVGARAGKGVFVLRVQNPCHEKPVIRGGVLQTSKHDAEHHGFGTLSIQTIAQKYDGSARFSVEEGQFELLIYLPLVE